MGAAVTQRETVLRLLREAGTKGVSAHVFNFDWGITRSASVVHELRQDGFSIRTVDEGTLPDGRQRLCRYILEQPSREGRDRKEDVDRGTTSSPDVPVPALPRPLPLPCGCIRSADGMGWDSRCQRHDPAIPAQEVEPW